MAKDMRPTEEQLAYATLLDLGMKIGLILLIITFGLYVFEVFPPYIPISHLPKVWGLNVHQYLQVTGIHPGWSWIKNISKGDFLNFLPLALLAGLTILCFLRILPIYLKKKDYLYGTLTILQILVLLLAASGLLKVGGH